MSTVQRPEPLGHNLLHNYAHDAFGDNIVVVFVNYILLTLRGHGDHRLRGGVVLILLHELVLGRRVSLEVVVVQELLERRRLGQQLIDHLPADVGRMLQPQLAQDLGLDGLQPQHFALLPPNAGGALVRAGVLVQQRQPGIRGRLAGRRQQQIGLVAP